MAFSGRKSSSCGHGSAGDEAGTAVDWPPLRGIKRHRRLLTALSAGHVHFDFLFSPGNLRRGDGGQSIVLGLLARLAALGFILQTFVMKKHLLADSPDELLVAIDASDRSILKFCCLALPSL